MPKKENPGTGNRPKQKQQTDTPVEDTGKGAE